MTKKEKIEEAKRLKAIIDAKHPKDTSKLDTEKIDNYHKGKRRKSTHGNSGLQAWKETMGKPLPSKHFSMDFDK